MKVPDSKRLWEVTSCTIGPSSRFCTTRTAKLSPGTLIESGRKLNCSIVTTSPKIHAGLAAGRPKSTRASTSPANAHLFRMYIGLPLIGRRSLLITFASHLFNPGRREALLIKQDKCHEDSRKCLRKSKRCAGGRDLQDGPPQPLGVDFNQEKPFRVRGRAVNAVPAG